MMFWKNIASATLDHPSRTSVKEWFLERLWGLYMGKFYDRLEDSVEYRWMQEMVVSSLSLSDDDRVLDLACGTGNTIVRMASHGSLDILGVDASPAAIRRAHQKLPKDRFPNVELVHADALEFIRAAQSGSFSKVAMTNFLYAMDDAQEVLKQVFRILRPGGVLVFVDPLPGSHPQEILHAQLRWRWERKHGVVEGVSVCARDIGRAIPLLLINELILSLERRGQFHFHTEGEHWSSLTASGFGEISTRRIYAQQNALFRAVKPDASGSM